MVAIHRHPPPLRHTDATPTKPKAQPYSEGAFVAKLQSLTADNTLSAKDVTALRAAFTKPKTAVPLSAPAQRLLQFQLSRVAFEGDQTRTQLAKLVKSFTGASV